VTGTATIGSFETMPCSNRYDVGCDWPPSAQWTVPALTSSGLYYARFGTGAEDPTKTNYVWFVVRAAPGAQHKILVQLPFTTWQAYNDFGGGSLYSDLPVIRVSLLRPLKQDPGSDVNLALPRTRTFINWLEKNVNTVGAVDYCTSIDLHRDSWLLNGYALVIIVGHDEYWSRNMRDHLDRFVRAGGNAMIFGGNTMYWQIRFETDGGTPNRIICCKDSGQVWAPISCQLPLFFRLRCGLVRSDYWRRFWFASISAANAFIFATVFRVFCTTRSECAISSLRDRAFAGSRGLVFFLAIDPPKEKAELSLCPKWPGKLTLEQ